MMADLGRRQIGGSSAFRYGSQLLNVMFSSGAGPRPHSDPGVPACRRVLRVGWYGMAESGTAADEAAANRELWTRANSEYADEHANGTTILA